MKKLAIPVLAALACLSCAPLPFDFDLSMSARTAGALTVEGTVGPVKLGEWETGKAVAMPELSAAGGLDLQSSFVYYRSSWGDRRLTFVTADPAQGAYRRIGPDAPLGAATSEAYPDLLLMTLKGQPHYAGWFALDPYSPAYNVFGTAWMDPAAVQLVAGTTVPLNSFSGVPGDVIGLSRYPQPDTSTDATYWLCTTGTPDQYAEMGSFVSSSGVAAPFTLPTRPAGAGYPLGSEMPLGLTRAMYFYDPEPTRAPQRSYLSWFDSANGRWRCWTWWAVNPWGGKELTSVDRRIDALLTTGELFSTEAETGWLFSSDGTLRTTFSLAGLRFIGESYVGGTALMLFSQGLYFDNQAWFTVYSIPTKDLAAVGD